MAPRRKVKTYTRTQHLSEIYHAGFQLAFVSPDLEQCHPWVLCKDFMTDALWADLHKKKASIYGFTYDPAKDPKLTRTKTVVVVRNRQKTAEVFCKEIKLSIKFINCLEERMGFKPSKAEQVECGKDGCVWMITGDKKWMHAPPVFSLYSLYLRVGCFYDGKGRLHQAVRDFKKNVKHNDAGYLKTSRKLRLLLLQSGLTIFKDKKEDNYPKSADIHEIHNQWGIVNAANCSRLQKIWDLSGLETIGKKTKKKDEEDEELTGGKKPVSKKKSKKKAKKKVAKKKAT